MQEISVLWFLSERSVLLVGLSLPLCLSNAIPKMDDTHLIKLIPQRIKNHDTKPRNSLCTWNFLDGDDFFWWWPKEVHSASFNNSSLISLQLFLKIDWNWIHSRKMFSSFQYLVSTQLPSSYRQNNGSQFVVKSSHNSPQNMHERESTFFAKLLQFFWT